MIAVVACGDAPPPTTPAPASAVDPRSPVHVAAPDAAVAAPDASPPGPPPTATLTLDAQCDTGALDVALAVKLAGKPTFHLDDNVHGSPGMAKLVEAEQASDDRGALSLARRIDRDGLTLAATRAATGVVTLRYRVRAAGEGVRFGLRADATGIGGVGAFFLVLPEWSRRESIRVVWGPAVGCPAGSSGFSSFTETTGELRALQLASFAYGRPRAYAVDDGKLHLRSAWFGTPAFDTAVAAAWAARVYAAERAFFADDDPEPYQIIVRVVPEVGERANGMGQERSFLSAIGPRTPFGLRLKLNTAHEMLHRWLGLRLRLAGPDGTAFWFTEGFDVYYAVVLLHRAGLLTPAEVAEELGNIVSRHAANPRANASNAEIARDFNSDEAVSTVPYTRGALYAAELDAAIRKASKGARSLDTIMQALYRDALASPLSPNTGLHELPAGAVRDAVVRELGTAGGQRYDAVIVRGGTPDPPSDAFGPCFERVAPARTWTIAPGGCTKDHATR